MTLGTVQGRPALLDPPMQVSFVQNHDLIQTLPSWTAQELLAHSLPSSRSMRRSRMRALSREP